MKANELRIGNILIKNKEVVTVMNIFGPSGLIQLKEEPFQRIPLLVQEIKGMNLTDDLLVKYGFDFKFDYLFMMGNDFYLRKITKIGFISDELLERPYYKYENFQPIRYVHQLQNLYFALTGEELTIIHPH